MKKLKIDKIAVKSFVTEIDRARMNTAKGGGTFLFFCQGDNGETRTGCGDCTNRCSIGPCPTDDPCDDTSQDP
ncbi:MAG: pinensin family lanthipeptide [Bacteroidota bacterium]